MRPGIIQDLRQNRAILPDIQAFLVFFEQSELSQLFIYLFRLSQLLMKDHYTVLVVSHLQPFAGDQTT